MNKFTIKALSAIDNLIAEKSLLLHPFYQAWTKGELNQEILRDYACQYYKHVAAFPRYLSAVHANTTEIEARRHILQNLVDEEAGSPNHPELWLKFANSLGADDASVKATTAYETTDNLIDTFMDVCRNGETANGLAALYAYESQIPAVSESKIDGLKAFYNLDTPSAISYFKVHIEADKEHAAVERQLLADYVTEKNFDSVIGSVNTTLDALLGMLTGLCHKHNIAC